MTLRDDVWDEVLEKLIADGKFRLSELESIEDDGQKHTARRTLRELERKGWLKRTSPQSPIWRMGEFAEMMLNVDEETLESADK